MRYEKGHKEETRKKIVGVAAEAFREKGLDGVGVADVMARAGLTHGGFYSHFGSKEELIGEVLDTIFDGGRLRKQRDEGHGLEAMIRSYLRTEHRDHPERGCAAAAFVGEIGRRPAATREAFAARMERM
ncbi:MAG TPA: TetR/AcrR family transcriptional regulator, partial [Candidatus Methylacidiphilales bacterium]